MERVWDGGCKGSQFRNKGADICPLQPHRSLGPPLFLSASHILSLFFMCVSVIFLLTSVSHLCVSWLSSPTVSSFLSDLSVAHLSCLFLISVSHLFLHLSVSLFSHSFSSLSASQSSFVLSFPQVFYFSFLLSFLSLFLTFTSFLIIFSFTPFFASYLPFSLPFIALCLPALHPLPCAACEVKGSADEKDRDMSPFFPLVRPLAHTRFYPSFLYLHKLQVELRKPPPSEASASILQPVSHASSPW